MDLALVYIVIEFFSNLQLWDFITSFMSKSIDNQGLNALSINPLMKSIRTNHLFLIFSFIVFSFIACADEEKNTQNDPVNMQSNELQTQPQSNDPQLDIQSPQEVRDDNGNIVYHYICPDNCEGGGSNLNGNCSVCGKKLAHNDLYHSYQQQTNTPPAGMKQAPAGTQPSPNMTPPPAQNASGVWHYTCPNGCSGGAGSKGSCASCGTALTHNQAYHNG